MSAHTKDVADSRFSWVADHQEIDGELSIKPKADDQNGNTSSTSGEDRQKDAMNGKEPDYILSEPVYPEIPPGRPARHPGMPTECRPPIQTRRPKEWKAYRKRNARGFDIVSIMGSQLSSGTHTLMDTVRSQLSQISLSGIQALSPFSSSDNDHAGESSAEDSPDRKKAENRFGKAMKVGSEAIRQRVQKARMPDMTWKEEDWNFKPVDPDKGNGGFTRKKSSRYPEWFRSRSRRILEPSKEDKAPPKLESISWKDVL